MATYTVSGGGNTLNQAINSAVANSTIYVEPGTYTAINATYGNRRVDVIATGGKSVTFIDGENQNLCIYHNASNYNQDTRYYDFTIQNGYNDNTKDAHRGAAFANCALYNCEIKNCHSYNLDNDHYKDPNGVSAAFNAISFRGWAYGCNVHHCTSNCILDRETRWIGCEIHHNTFTCDYLGDAFAFYGSPMYRCNVHHNTCKNDNVAAAGNFGMGNQVACLVHDNDVYWLMERPNAKNTIYYNNTCRGNVIDNFGMQMKIKNCVFINNTGGYSLYNYNTTRMFSNWFCNAENIHNVKGINVTGSVVRDNHFDVSLQDFGFVDPANEDFRLVDESPLIHSGTWEGDASGDATGYWNFFPGWKQDYDSVLFNVNGNPSVGAFEWNPKGNLYLPDYMHPFGM